MTNLNALPIACTLAPGDLREWLGAIQALTREALLGYERDGLESGAPVCAGRHRACARHGNRRAALLRVPGV